MGLMSCLPKRPEVPNGNIFSPVTDNENDNARMKYQNSIEEERDIEREFISGKGSMTHMLNCLPFMRIKDEERIIAIIKKIHFRG